MSIINDALKKAGKLKAAEPEAKSFGLKNLFIWTGAGLLCILGIILATTTFKTSPKTTIEFAPVQQRSELDAPPDAFQLKEMEIKPVVKDPEFNLNGILYDQHKPMAIINSRIVEEGAFLNGAQILEIQPDLVKLSREGKEFKIKIK